MKDFFVSYTKADQAWAEWLAWQLEEAGYQTILDLWDFRPGSNFVLSIDRAASRAIRTLAVISPDYLGALYTQPEWAAALARDPLGQDSSLIPIRVRACDVQGLLRAIVFIDLVGLEEQKALEVLLQGIANSRMKPDRRPIYPGHPISAPFFPGERTWRSLGPRYDNEEIRNLAEELNHAYQNKEELLFSGQDVSYVEQKILSLRRQMREGGQLKAGDFLQEGRFRLIETIGRGGFATVWRALDRRESNIVAVKILHVDLAHDRTRCERFFRGARKMADLRHQGIVRVIEREIDDVGYRAFVMEYIEGGDFYQAVVSGKLSLADRVRIIQEVGAALQFAHNSGVIHRDVKPANILLTSDSRPKLTDFDLVRAFDTTGGTRTGMLGTFVYAAPEAMEKAKDVGQSADVYGLGMTLLFALTGADLGPDAIKDSSKIIKNIKLNRDMRALLTRAVSWDPSKRLASVAEFCSALRKYFPLTRDAGRDDLILGMTPALAEEDPESRFRFESFFVGGSNELAYSAARAVAERPFVAYNPLFIYGGSGLGKSHLLRAIADEISRTHSHLNVVNQHAEEITNRIIEAIRSGGMRQFREWSRSIEVLLIDDFQFVAKKDKTQEELFHIFNSLIQRKGQIVLSADSSPKDIPALEERLRRRIESGLVVALSLPGIETKVAILRMKSRLQGVELPDDAAIYIARRCNAVSELEGALNRLFATSSLDGRTISVEFASSILEDLLRPWRKSASATDIIKFVARHYDLKVSEIKSKSNARAISFPRQVAMYLCKKLADLSYPEVGKLFNDKHHSTVMYAIQKIEEQRKADPGFDKMVKKFEAWAQEGA